MKSGIAAVSLVCAAVVMSGCEDNFRTTAKTTQVTIGGKTFTLELAMDDATRLQGLSGRESTPEDGGMLFVFPDALVSKHEFVMRDCPAPIDIIFLDRSRRVTAVHAMLVETPRKADEDMRTYENRLKRYSSRFDSQYAIELRGGTLEKISVKPGEFIAIDPTLTSKAK